MDTKLEALTSRECVFGVTLDVYPADDVKSDRTRTKCRKKILPRGTPDMEVTSSPKSP